MMLLQGLQRINAHKVLKTVLSILLVFNKCKLYLC